MKRHIVILLTLALLWSLLPVSAQGDGDQRLVWSPYDFSVEIPAGWTSHMTSERLLLGTQEAIDAVQAGRLPDGVIVEIEVVEPAVANDAFLLEGYQFLRDFTVEPVQYGDAEWLTMEMPPSIGTRQGKMVLVAQTFRLTASGSTATWWEVDEQTVNTLIASIHATPVQRPAPDRLTQTIAWRNLRFRAPNHLNPCAVADGVEQTLWLINQDSRLRVSRTFEFNILYFFVRDLSPLRHMLTPADTLLVEGLMYDPTNIDQQSLEDYELAGYPAVRAEFMYGDAPGIAVAVKTPSSLYLIFGQAGAEEWEATERDLFEAILATIEITD